MEDEKTKIKTKTKKKTNLLFDILCDILKAILDYGISIYLVLILAVMPFYNREGYSHIGTDKAYFFRNVITKSGSLLLSVAVIYLVVLAVHFRKELWSWLRQHISLTDLFAGGYGLVLIISYLCSGYKETALWGTTGWFMGFWPQMALVLTYFLVSKLWKPRRWMIYMTFMSSGLVFLLGFLNRIGVDPLNMGNLGGAFISTVGNINWYCGYLVSVFFAGAALLWQGKDQKWWLRLLLILYVAVGFSTLITQGSDSGLVALTAVMLTMFVLSAPDSGRMLMFWLEILLLGGMGLITYTIRVMAPRALRYNVGVGVWLTSGWRPFFVTAVSIVIIALVQYCRKKRIYPEKGLNIFNKILLAVVSLTVIALIAMIAVNTLWPGKLGSLSEQPIFTFSVKWGSNRGATWMAGWMCFAEQGLLHKLVGVGPDSMSAYLYADASSELVALVKESFGNQVLSNAHNEWLTVLVNTGILGLVTFGGMIVTGIRRFLKETGRNEIVCACGFCLLAYTANNVFSFQQSMNTATIFAIFGMGGAFLRKEKVTSSK